MAVKVEASAAHEVRVDVVVVPVLEAGSSGDRRASVRALDAALEGLITSAHKTGAFKGKAGQVLPILTGGRIPAPRVLLTGLGPRKKLNEECIRRAAAAAARQADDPASLAFDLVDIPGSLERSAEAVVVGQRLATYRFKRFKSEKKPRRATRLSLLAASEDLGRARAGARIGEAVAAAVETARDLGNLPGSHCTPRILAREARAMARRQDLGCEVLTERRMAELKMGSLLSVSRGSREEARLIVLEHGRRRQGKPTVCLVGKGLTFDSGGISLKPPAEMDKMRYDMCGGAAVIGAMEAVARLKLPLHVVGIVPSSENMPGGLATRPGDIVTAMNRKTIEVLNTDAEGRLILADALCYAQRYQPDLIIDLATLTGAVLVALGKHMAGMLGTDEKAMGRLSKAARETHERVWQLPLDDDYDKAIQGKSADLLNVGGRNAGTITAAQFLKHFTNERPSIHLDIAGVSWDDSTRIYNKGSGATGFGVRLLTRFLQQMAT